MLVTRGTPQLRCRRVWCSDDSLCVLRRPDSMCVYMHRRGTLLRTGSWQLWHWQRYDGQPYHTTAMHVQNNLTAQRHRDEILMPHILPIMRNAIDNHQHDNFQPQALPQCAKSPQTVWATIPWVWLVIVLMSWWRIQEHYLLAIQIFRLRLESVGTCQFFLILSA